jgi:hypothetical protein
LDPFLLILDTPSLNRVSNLLLLSAQYTQTFTKTGLEQAAHRDENHVWVASLVRSLAAWHDSLVRRISSKDDDDAARQLPETLQIAFGGERRTGWKRLDCAALAAAAGETAGETAAVDKAEAVVEADAAAAARGKAGSGGGRGDGAKELLAFVGKGTAQERLEAGADAEEGAETGASGPAVRGKRARTDVSGGGTAVE